MDRFFVENGFNSLNFLFNNSYEYENVSICGTRGWVNITKKAGDNKILKREANRLELSLKTATKTPIVFLHYPPIFGCGKAEEILKVIQKNKVKKVYYGHLHGKFCKNAVVGELDKIEYSCISSDYLKFKLLKIL